MRKLAPIAEPLFADPASMLQSRAWKQHFGEQTDYYEQVLRWVDPFHKSYGQVEPDASYRKKGLIAYADGTKWNPGEGAGEYWYNGSAWKKIPRIGETATTPLDKSWIPAIPSIQVAAAPYPGTVTTRAIGTTYRNTTGKVMWVSVSLRSSSATASSGITDSASTPTTVVDFWYIPGATTEHTIKMIVLPNNYYKVTTSAGTPTLLYWTEWY